MKLLTVAVPCYNSQAYMRKCIESLLAGGDEMEIIIVDDGSTDDTLKIAREYEAAYPQTVRAVHQENKGHGGAVNTGLAHAGGMYFKVVDSDDWLDGEALARVLQVLDTCVKGSQTLDLLICNYIYDKVGARKKAVMNYRASLPQDRILGWGDVKKLPQNRYLLMHSLIYRTQLLRESGMVLPEHTFYVDNLVAFIPLACVKTLYYLDANLYHYYIGRSDQSVSEQVMIGRLDQQIAVNKKMIDYMAGVRNLQKNQRKYMMHMLIIITTVSSMLALRSGTDENYAKKKELWHYLKERDFGLYSSVRLSLLGRMCNLPGKGGRTVSVAGYRIVQKIYGFN